MLTLSFRLNLVQLEDGCKLLAFLFKKKQGYTSEQREDKVRLEANFAEIIREIS